MLLKMNLERSGQYEVEVVNHSLGALSAARQFRPDVVLLDLVMPGLDGGAVAAQFEDDPCLRHVPIILLTGLVDCDEFDPESSLQAGSMRALPKPVNMDLLTRCIASAIQAEKVQGSSRLRMQPAVSSFAD